MGPESPVSLFNSALAQLSISILPAILLASTCAWADDAEPALNNTGNGTAASGIPHMDVNDPPPFEIITLSTTGMQDEPQGTPAACPPFVFRNGYESGTLSQTGGPGTTIRYLTSGGYLVQVQLHTITLQDPIAKNQIQHWGDPHENLNGKHIKDWAGAAGWDGTRRTIMLGDGTKVTMDSAGAQGVVLTTSIYDAGQNVQIANSTNTIVSQGVDATATAVLDDAQHDGETSQFVTHLTTGVATYSTIYNEDDEFVVVPFSVTLGISGGCANPNNVADYFDDPRLGHT